MKLLLRLKTIFLFFLLISSCENTTDYRPDQHPLPTKTECAEFMNFFVNERICFKSDSMIVPDRDYVTFFISPDDSAYILSKVPTLSEKDIAFMRKQLSVNKIFWLSKIAFCPNVKIVSTDSILALKLKNPGNFWTPFHKKYGDSSLVRLSKPVFSIDRSVALVRYSKMRGELSGSGGLAIYERMEEKWVLKCITNRWVA